MNKNYDYKRLTPFKWFVLQNFPFIDEDFDAITNYQLFCKLGEEINKVIESQNLVGTQVEELTTAFNNLQDYINNYFENLDVQDEINNKLDEMARNGELTDIITQYLQLNGLLCFNTKTNLKGAENLINGSFAKTFGKTTYNDGYGEFYKIRTILNTDVIDDNNIVALTNYPSLIAEKIPNIYNNKVDRISNIVNYDIIVDKDGSGDYTTIQEAVTNAISGNRIYIKNGNYTNEIIDCLGKNLYLIGESRENVIISNDLASYNRQPLTIAKGYVENITVKALNTGSEINNGSYAVHIDSDDLINSTLIFKNCFFNSHCNAAVGIGLKPNCYLKFENCQLSCSAPYNISTNKNASGLFVHTSNTTEGGNQNLILQNCLIEGRNTPAMVMQSCQSINNKGYIQVLGCTFNSIFGNGINSIQRNLHYTATSYNIYLKNENFSNNNLVNGTLYTKAENTPVPVIGKFLNDTLDYPIKRRIITFEKNNTDDYILNYSDIDSDFVEEINIYGRLKHSNGLAFPLGYGNSNNYFDILNDIPNKRYLIKSNLVGDIRLIIEYWINNN